MLRVINFKFADYYPPIKLQNTKYIHRQISDYMIALVMFAYRQGISKVVILERLLIMTNTVDEAGSFGAGR